MKFAELIRQIDAWHFKITLFVMMQFEAIVQDERDCKKIQSILDGYQQSDRQWTVLHMQLVKKQKDMFDDFWVALATAYNEHKFIIQHDGKGLCEFSEPTWSSDDSSQFASLRNKWEPYIRKARINNRKEDADE
jgi:hypothetical protein